MNPFDLDLSIQRQHKRTYSDNQMILSNPLYEGISLEHQIKHEKTGNGPKELIP